MTSSSEWIMLASTMSSRFEPNQLLKINDLEFAKYNPQSKCIQKYNTIVNKWTEWIKIQDFIVVVGAAFALNQHKLYVYCSESLMIINIKEKTRNIYDFCDNCGYNSASIIINNKLHLVGGLNNEHVVWNEQQSQFDMQQKFVEVSNLIFHRLIYLKSKNILLCIGGVASGKTMVMDTIYSYDITVNKWTKLQQTLPIGNNLFGCIATRNDKYVILFGGNGVDIGKTIYILNTKTMTFSQSAICCPEKGTHQAINMNSKENEQLLCFGYIKKLWNTNEFNGLMNLPFYLTNIIRHYVSFEMIYLINENSGCHWKINVDEIISKSVDV